MKDAWHVEVRLHNLVNIPSSAVLHQKAQWSTGSHSSRSNDFAPRREDCYFEISVTARNEVQNEDEVPFSRLNPPISELTPLKVWFTPEQVAPMPPTPGTTRQKTPMKPPKYAVRFDDSVFQSSQAVEANGTTGTKRVQRVAAPRGKPPTRCTLPSSPSLTSARWCTTADFVRLEVSIKEFSPATPRGVVVGSSSLPALSESLRSLDTTDQISFLEASLCIPVRDVVHRSKLLTRLLHTSLGQVGISFTVSMGDEERREEEKLRNCCAAKERSDTHTAKEYHPTPYTYRSRLTQFLQMHHPKGLALVDQVLAAGVPELTSFTRLYREFEICDYQKRLQKFCAAYRSVEGELALDPSSTSCAELLEEWKDREEELMRELVLSHGPETQHIYPQEWRWRAFLQHHGLSVRKDGDSLRRLLYVHRGPHRIREILPPPLMACGNSSWVSRSRSRSGSRDSVGSGSSTSVPIQFADIDTDDLFEALTAIYGPEPDPRSYLFPPTSYVGGKATAFGHRRPLYPVPTRHAKRSASTEPSLGRNTLQRKPGVVPSTTCLDPEVRGRMLRQLAFHHLLSTAPSRTTKQGPSSAKPTSLPSVSPSESAEEDRSPVGSAAHWDRDSDPSEGASIPSSPPTEPVADAPRSHTPPPNCWPVEPLTSPSPSPSPAPPVPVPRCHSAEAVASPPCHWHEDSHTHLLKEDAPIASGYYEDVWLDDEPSTARSDSPVLRPHSPATPAIPSREEAETPPSRAAIAPVTPSLRSSAEAGDDFSRSGAPPLRCREAAAVTTALPRRCAPSKLPLLGVPTRPSKAENAGVPMESFETEHSEQSCVYDSTAAVRTSCPSHPHLTVEYYAPQHQQFVCSACVAEETAVLRGLEQPYSPDASTPMQLGPVLPIYGAAREARQLLTALQRATATRETQLVQRLAVLTEEMGQRRVRYRRDVDAKVVGLQKEVEKVVCQMYAECEQQEAIDTAESTGPRADLERSVAEAKRLNALVKRAWVSLRPSLAHCTSSLPSATEVISQVHQLCREDTTKEFVSSCTMSRGSSRSAESRWLLHPGQVSFPSPFSSTMEHQKRGEVLEKEVFRDCPEYVKQRSAPLSPHLAPHDTVRPRNRPPLSKVSFLSTPMPSYSSSCHSHPYYETAMTQSSCLRCDPSRRCSAPSGTPSPESSAPPGLSASPSPRVSSSIRASAAVPSSKERLALGWQYLKEGRPTEVVKQVWDSVLELVPFPAEVHPDGCRAMAYTAEALDHNIPAALYWYRRAIELDPEEPTTYYNLGVLYENSLRNASGTATIATKSVLTLALEAYTAAASRGDDVAAAKASALKERLHVSAKSPL